MSTEVENCAKRRLAFQKTYSQEMGGWRKRSLIDDAKFETLANQEFEKRERKISNTEIAENDDVFAQNGGHPASPKPESVVITSYVIKLKEGLGSVARILKLFENTKTTLLHIESRQTRTKGRTFELFLECQGSKDTLASITNALHQHPVVQDGSVTVVGEKTPNKKELWFPRHISDLDKCTHLLTKFEPDLDYEHPGFADKEYRQRRKMIADIAFDYREGEPIPRIDYVQTEIDTWSHVYRQLKNLHPTHACSDYQQNFEMLERECGYSENNIPQLQDVSTFLKRKTGFQLRPVAGLLSPRDFLASLAFRVFQCTQYVRHGAKPDYSPEPDCVHELLGHVPMMADPTFAQFSQELGIVSLGAADADIEKIATLYWFTVEFGLCKENGEIRAYGAGTLSAYGELKHALSDKPKVLPFDPDVTSLQEYTDDDFQPVFFVIESFEEMMDKVRQFSSRIKRPYEVHYDPFTQCIQLLNSKGMLHQLARNLHSELDNLQRAIDRIHNVTIN
ncbi:tryptophan 5-hydroxylase 1-like [Littorina saxatilis]|uniref:tryptophan 5-hydroxylase 1-like n=1 Tax=Littorina saxatilis TaxID=31220 RepID=UPI0038B49B3A